VTELDQIVILNLSANTLVFWEGLSRKDDPVVVGIVERVTGDLLALTTVSAALSIKTAS
jgi:hypothetical protein